MRKTYRISGRAFDMVVRVNPAYIKVCGIIFIVGLIVSSLCRELPVIAIPAMLSVVIDCVITFLWVFYPFSIKSVSDGEEPKIKAAPTADTVPTVPLRAQKSTMPTQPEAPKFRGKLAQVNKLDMPVKVDSVVGNNTPPPKPARPEPEPQEQETDTSSFKFDEFFNNP